MDHWLCVYDNITFIDDALPQADHPTGRSWVSHSDITRRTRGGPNGRSNAARVSPRHPCTPSVVATHYRAHPHTTITSSYIASNDRIVFARITSHALSHRFTEEPQTNNSHTPTAVHSPFVDRGTTADQFAVRHIHLCSRIQCTIYSNGGSCTARTHHSLSTRVYYRISLRLSNCRRSTRSTVDVCLHTDRGLG